MNKKSKILSTTINKSTSSLMDDFNSSIDIDKRLIEEDIACLLYTSPSPRDKRQSRMPSSA